MASPEKFIDISLKYSIYTSFIIFSIGIIGNLINLIVFTNLTYLRNNRCIFYLTIETISDSFSQFLSVLIYIFIVIYGNTFTTSSLIWCRLIYMLIQGFALITFSMICFMSIDQYFSRNSQYNLTFNKLRWFVFASICICFLHGLICCLFVNIVPLNGCILTNRILIQYFTYFFYPILAGFLPIIIVTIFIFLVYRNVRHIIRHQIPIQRRRLDQQITSMILLRIIYFVFISLIYVSFRIYMINISLINTDFMKYAILQLIQAIIFSIGSLNQTLNFYIFMIFSSRYRRQVKHVLLKKFWQKYKNWFCIKENQVHPENIIPSVSNNELE